MKFKTRILALLLVLVMLLPMVVSCKDMTVENKPVADKSPVAGETAPTPDAAEKTDAKALLLELLKESQIDASMSQISVKFKGDITVSFLDPSVSYSTSDIEAAENGYVDIPMDALYEMLYAIIEENGLDLGSIEGGVNQIILETLLNGEFGSFEELIASITENVTLDNFAVQYGSAENYLTALLVSRLVYAACMKSEEAAHADDENGIPEDCINIIETNVWFTMDLVKNVLLAENDAEAIEALLYEITAGYYMNVLTNGCINGEGNGDEMESMYYLGQVLTNIYDYISSNADEYDEGDNTIYYDALVNNDNLLMIMEIATATYFVHTDYNAYGVMAVYEALDAYLASEDGPIMQGDFGKVALAIGAAVVTIANVNDIIKDAELEGSVTTYGYFDLADEKWYYDNGDEIVVGDGEQIFNISGSPVDYIYNGSVPTQAIYEIYVGEHYIDFDETVEAMVEKVFGIYTSAMADTEVSENDALLLSTVIAVYLGTYPQQNPDFALGIDLEFASKYILATIGGITAEAAELALYDIAVLLGLDNGAAENFVEDYLAKYVSEDETVDDLNEQILYTVVNVLYSMEDWDAIYDRYDTEYVITDLANHLYVKYLMEHEGEKPDYDGIPLYVAAGVLYAFANENLGIELDSEIYDYYFENYKGDSDNSTYEDEPLVYYEDFLAMMLMLVNEGSLDMLFAYDYPFDYVEHKLAEGIVMSVLAKRAENDEDQSLLQSEAQIMAAVLDDVFTNNAPQADRFVLITYVILVSVDITRMEDIELADDIAYAFGGYASEYLTEKYKDVDYNGEDYDITDALGMYITSLFDELDTDYTVLRYMIDTVNGTDDPDYNAALEIAITDAIMGVDTSDPAAFGDFLGALGTVLVSNGIPAFGMLELADAFNAIVLEDGDNPYEAMLDELFLLMYGESELDYTVLTDVVFALMSVDNNPETTEDDEALAAAIEAAITELSGNPIDDIKGDFFTIGYLRALAGYEMTDAAYANAFTVLYIISDIGDPSLIATLPSVLYMTEEEFRLYFEFTHTPQYLEVRAWADKYIGALMADPESVDMLEATVDFLVASGYYSEDEIPEATDPAYYEKLAAIYMTEHVLGDEDYAEAVVAVMFDRNALSTYAATFLEMADAFAATEADTTLAPGAFNVAKLALYAVSTVAHLEIANPISVDWEKVLAFIPETYEMITGEPLAIANYAALADMLRASFAEDILASIEVECVPYDNASQTIFVFTVKGSVEHSGVNGDFEMIIEIVVPKIEAV